MLYSYYLFYRLGLLLFDGKSILKLLGSVISIVSDVYRMHINMEP